MRTAIMQSGGRELAGRWVVSLPVIFRRYRRHIHAALLLVIGPWLAFVTLDRLAPLPVRQALGAQSVIVTAEDGTPLRAFADEEGVWRYPVSLDEVSPLYIEALLNYEDRWFYRHGGVNPFALLRAGVQWAWHGRVVSGGSTLSMQVARLIDPHPRTVAGKLRQMFRALQLEWHYDKREILELYVNLAPFGGPLQGVQAASYAYLGKPVRELSHAEAALLAVLPQSPSRLRPDRHAPRARRARDKVLRRLARFGVWPAQTVREARQEQVLQQFHAQPLIAPLLARRLRARHPQVGLIRTTLDAGLQLRLEDRLANYISRYPAGTSAAILVVDNETLAVRAYLGSARFGDARRFGHIDMVTALRSPGSTLKPFLYGMAMDAGLIHSESLLVDAPQNFDGYRPLNFTREFHGPVSVSYALQQSLNVPAVDLLARFGPQRFVARLRNAHIRLHLPDGRPNLSVILGGAGTRLETLVSAYTALARDGMSARLRYRPEDPLVQRPLLSAGAAWIIRDILESRARPELRNAGIRLAGWRRVAVKTGTSYGLQDAWALGVTDRYTLGVWVGRPDGTASPGEYGAVTAVPLLFHLVDSMPDHALWGRRRPRPATVRQTTVCWPLGGEPDPRHPAACQVRRTAWVLGDQVPLTLPDRIEARWTPRLQTVWVDADSGQRVGAACEREGGARQARTLVRWPVALEPWLTPTQRRASLPPRWAEGCVPQGIPIERSLRIVGLAPRTVVRRAGPNAPRPAVALRAVGARGALFWLVNGRLVNTTGPNGGWRYPLRRPGRYEITALDENGGYDRVLVKYVP